MSKDMNRREFLKTSVTTGAVLVGGNLFQGGSVAYGSVKIPEIEKPRL